VVLITGATAGIGWSTAIAAAEAGASVFAGGRDVERGQRLEEALRGLGATASFHPLDVAVPRSITDFVDHALDRFGRLDGCVNNAGVEGRLAPLHLQSDEDFDAIINVNLRGVFQCMRSEIAAMAASGGGAIVNTGSVGSFIGLSHQSLYAATKHAVWALTRSAAVECAALGIRINMVAPAGTETPMLTRIVPDPSVLAAAAATHPIGRFGRPEEVAQAIVWLLSDQASYVCGQSIGVDGGYSATLGFRPKSQTDT
jgi:NAD(P)-dependent dehydrogenase (short-subunit alcohol dehydrogenase family)